MRVLVIEDDPMIGRAVVAGLHDGGYTVDWVRDGADAELALANGVYDLALLDLGLPRRDGLEILKGLRRAGKALPVVIITARDAVADRVIGLDNGADDYLVKPFDLDELLARARAVVRRREGRSSPEMSYGALSIDPVKRVVSFRGAQVDLSPREFAVLEALMKEPGAVVSREKLEDAVYGWGEEVGSNSIEVHLHHLRRKLKPQLIRNVRGVGYRIAHMQ
ncbi:MAG: DNA-binding response regulator [Betaproteobacteria bacterium RIFCSPLOWO2_12_FULL_65_14]|nr:MAG: DNA-binding response regulator [Betaproteobacteria bacterium RIFCSPLOWO2_12_FULL_65_14]